MSQESVNGSRSEKVAVLGAGSWGTVVAHLLSNNSHEVMLWSHRADHAASIQRGRVNARYLPELQLRENLHATADMSRALQGASTAFVAVPVRAVEEVTGLAAAAGFRGTVVSCAKGLEVGTLKRVSELTAESLPESPTAVLSGPNLATEIARGLPAAATVASSDKGVARAVQRLLHQATFRLYTSGDVAGVEVAGALKNVIAIASGLSDGLGMGENTRATLITRGLVELVRLGVAMGGDISTFYGLAGLGDLIATCSSVRSRNHQAGRRIAQGESVEQILASGLTAEGVHTVRAIAESELGRMTRLPITVETYRVLFEGKDPNTAIKDLMTRAEGAE